jgi:hypothetical protein
MTKNQTTPPKAPVKARKCITPITTHKLVGFKKYTDNKGKIKYYGIYKGTDGTKKLVF